MKPLPDLIKNNRSWSCRLSVTAFTMFGGCPSRSRLNFHPGIGTPSPPRTHAPRPPWRWGLLLRVGAESFFHNKAGSRAHTSGLFRRIVFTPHQGRPTPSRLARVWGLCMRHGAFLTATSRLHPAARTWPLAYFLFGARQQNAPGGLGLRLSFTMPRCQSAGATFLPSGS